MIRSNDARIIADNMSAAIERALIGDTGMAVWHMRRAREIFTESAFGDVAIEPTKQEQAA